MKETKWEFWVDKGGTFTDIIGRSSNGLLITHKLLSEKNHLYADATIQGIREILKLKPNEPISTHCISSIRIGTTVATNALLERKGEPLLLAITEGFEDSLRIGYQNRPNLFDLNIKLPSVIYQGVIAIKERVDAQGNILQAIDDYVVEQALESGYRKGFRALAIILMHGYRYTDHEQRVAQIAKRIGYTQVSASHEVVPIINFISRGNTTVVDAYLSPPLMDYIGHLQVAFPNVPLFFMQGNGRLAQANLFRGKDSLLSGPAGGVVGMVKTGLAAGFNKVIGFDMGGTSTDVSHYTGEYERSYSTEIAGVALRVPMMLINTIAAGGGSILHFDGQRYRVGPDSAAASPGPACYRQGGPLTITDCNVIVGKIQPQFFPKLFGSRGNLIIDAQVVHQKFLRLSRQIKRDTGIDRTPQQIAEGFLNIAVENMANAIKKISLQRGYDVTQYLLNCYGGAGGQHACLVADLLGIKKILIHPFTGLLSAYGVGLGEMGSIREHTIEKNLTEKSKQSLLKIFYQLSKEVTAKFSKELKDSSKIILKKNIHLRYEGSNTALITAFFNNVQTIKKEFQRKHQQQFGFISQSKKITIESISVEAVLERKDNLITDFSNYQRTAKKQLASCANVKIFTKGEFHNAPLFLREDLKPGDCIKGPAIISELNATTIIEIGWQATVDPNFDLLITRYEEVLKAKVPIDYDPVMLEIFNNRFMNIAEQMGEILRQTASSVNIKERLDFSCAIFDQTGELVANAPHIPVHLGSMSESVKSILHRFGDKMQPGDAFMLNSPYEGGTHLPDITVISPVFYPADKLLFLVGSRGHHADIGGIAPGSIPAKSKIIQEEGVLISNYQLMARGQFFEKRVTKLLTDAIFPARNPTQNIADLKAQIAANQRGIHMLLDLVSQFSSEIVLAYMRYVRSNAKRATEKMLTNLKNGNFQYALDDGSKIKVLVEIDSKNKRALIDFTGSCEQHRGNFNAPKAVCQAAVIYVIRCLVNEDIPLNSGCLEPIDIVIPTPSMLNPSYPAAVVAGNVETSQCIVDTLLGAFQAVAASQGTCNNFTFGNEDYQYYETICGGAGAGPSFNGSSAVHTHMTNTRLTDPEILEYRFPVLLEEFSIRHGSGGAGKFHGGDGVIRRIKFLASMTANIISSHRKVPPYGLFGGCAGQVGSNWIQRADGTIQFLDSCAEVEMEPGDVFIIETPGGGGWGKLYPTTK